MQWIVAYDISSNKIRNRVSNILIKYGYRIQYSVFYIPEASRKEIEDLKEIIKPLINPKTDRIFFYPIEEITVFKGYPIQPWDIQIL
ncbi:MAG TPA: CRISPR-associated endonuclease Cas2 [Aquifex aeolicus]|nr:CRISPR-associated endonuclease Cas2 [Aquifex aeolicus]